MWNIRNEESATKMVNTKCRQLQLAGTLSTAERSYSTSEVRAGGWEELTCIRGQGRRPRGATPLLRQEAGPERSHPASEVGAEAKRSHPAPEAKGFGRKEQPPHPRSGAAAGRINPMSKEQWLPGHRRA